MLTARNPIAARRSRDNFMTARLSAFPVSMGLTLSYVKKKVFRICLLFDRKEGVSSC
jgi:hypothetical protein